MFHTFETSQYQTPEQADAAATSTVKRRTSTVRACEPCRRRKIRCNGEHPCETCQWYRKAASCHYTEPRQRQVPSRRSVEKISQTLQEYRGILQKLFPSIHPEQLTGMSRDKLIDLISKTSPFQPPSPLTPSHDDKPPSIHPDAGSLEQLQLPPDDSNDHATSHHKSQVISGAIDDVNALGLSMKQSSSYLGISSVMAALRVIVWLDPDCQTYVNRSAHQSGLGSRDASPSITGLQTTPHTDRSSISAWDELPRINAYFKSVQPFAPLLDEQGFRDVYMSKSRDDPRWHLLLNAVLAMGSLAHGDADDTTHSLYFARAKEHLNVETLSSAHIETVQALAILSGLYLHYLQEANLANALMGALLRMTTMLGLHRDFTENVSLVDTQKAKFPIELRRRIWWSIFILDTNACTALGRPSMGRMSHAITAAAPQEPIGDSVTLMVLMQENIRLSVISTQMEDCLAYSPLIDEHERQSLDAKFVEWYHSSSVQPSTSQPLSSEIPGITSKKNVMRWRYLFARVLLHRPALLWYAMRKIPFDQLSEDKRVAIEVCREVTTDLINDITTTWQGQKPNQMSGWNATWLLYQAAMVPLLSLFSDRLDSDIVEAARQQIELTISILSQLRRWSSTARHSLEVVSRIYEASRRHQHPDSLHQSGFQTPATLHSTPIMQHQQHSQVQQRPNFIDVNYGNMNQHPLHPSSTAASGPFLTPNRQELFMDNMFDSLNWSTGWTNNDFPFETPSLGWDRNAVNGWAGGAAGAGLDAGVPTTSVEYESYFHHPSYSGPPTEESLSLSSEMGYLGQAEQGVAVSLGHYGYH